MPYQALSRNMREWARLRPSLNLGSSSHNKLTIHHTWETFFPQRKNLRLHGKLFFFNEEITWRCGNAKLCNKIQCNKSGIKLSSSTSLQIKHKNVGISLLTNAKIKEWLYESNMKNLQNCLSSDLLYFHDHRNLTRNQEASNLRMYSTSFD